MKFLGPEKLRDLLPKLDSRVFCKEVFDQAGIFIIRGAVPGGILQEWLEAWDAFYATKLAENRKVNRFNPVAVDEIPPAPLSEIHKCPAILDVIEQAMGADIALYNQRFVIKDHNSRGAVFLHQDYPYHFGWPFKASAFIALSQVNERNGGMFFYPGSHQFGYLGDAGEINPDILPPDWPKICPSLEPGDFVLMNSLTWHASGPHLEGCDRVLVDVIYQPAFDPSSVALLRGQWQTEIFLSDVQKRSIFNRSRSIRLKEMQLKLDQYEPPVSTSQA
jgi:ectoine hydroxylase-related dioxygenase (phytanoyl-CoA dioxygenase family)